MKPHLPVIRILLAPVYVWHFVSYQEYPDFFLKINVSTEYGSSQRRWYLFNRMERVNPRTSRGMFSSLILWICPIFKKNNNTSWMLMMYKLFVPFYIWQTHFDGRLFELRITCGPEYPVKPPKVRFTSRINLSSVNQTTGAIENDLPALAHWNRNMTMYVIIFT
jgi:hypothetical protein